MATTSNTAAAWDERPGRLSPADVHSVLFTRAGLGRRGYDETEVDVFLDRVQTELSRLIAEKAELRDEVTRLKSQLEQAGTVAKPGEPSRDEASLQAVRILSAAQQTADQYVADAEHYSRRMSVEAREQYEQLVAEARAQAKEILAEADRITREIPGEVHVESTLNGSAKNKQELEQQVAYLRTFGEVCRVQLRSYLESLLRAIEDEWGRADPKALAAGGFGVGPLALGQPPAAPEATAPVPPAAGSGQAAESGEPTRRNAPTGG